MPDDLDLLADLDDPALDPAGHHRAAARDREHVLDRHQERQVHRALRLRDVAVHRRHQVGDLRPAHRLVAAFQRRQGRALDDRDVVAREAVLGQQLADLELDQLEQLLVVDHVDLVQIDHDRRHAHLPRQQDVLPGLRHRPVGGRDHQDRPVHLRGTGDHVLDVVGVPRAVDVRVVPVAGLVLDVRGVDRDPARLLLRRLVDLVVRREMRPARLRQHLGDRRRQRRLAVVDVTDRPDVAVRLRPRKLFFGHLRLLGSHAMRVDARRAGRPWSGWRESNPHRQLGRLELYH